MTVKNQDIALHPIVAKSRWEISPYVDYYETTQNIQFSGGRVFNKILDKCYVNVLFYCEDFLCNGLVDDMAYDSMCRLCCRAKDGVD